MEQIDALRAMLADATPGEWRWVEYARCTPGEKYAVGTNDVAVAKLPKEADARLIAAMHNALPALLDAAEMVENPGTFSDGYHTFDDLYDQRAVLFAALCAAYPEKAWKSRLHSDGTMFDGGYFICGIETPIGQYTYHYKMNRWDLYDVTELDNAPEWDGHTDKDVLRLMQLAAYREREGKGE